VSFRDPIGDAVRTEIARQNEAAATALPVPAAQVPASSLPPDLLETKRALEAAMVPGGEYWAHEKNQQAYRDLVRAEQQGATDAVGPLFEPDADLPVAADRYDISAAAGARSMSALDRDIINDFLPVAHVAGLGQRKVTQAIGWALTGAADTVEHFKSLAIAAGWSDRAIDICIDWHRAARKHFT